MNKKESIIYYISVIVFTAIFFVSCTAPVAQEVKMFIWTDRHTITIKKFHFFRNKEKLEKFYEKYLKPSEKEAKAFVSFFGNNSTEEVNNYMESAYDYFLAQVKEYSFLSKKKNKEKENLQVLFSFYTIQTYNV